MGLVWIEGRPWPPRRGVSGHELNVQDIVSVQPRGQPRDLRQCTVAGLAHVLTDAAGVVRVGSRVLTAGVGDRFREVGELFNRDAERREQGDVAGG